MQGQRVGTPDKKQIAWVRRCRFGMMIPLVCLGSLYSICGPLIPPMPSIDEREMSGVTIYHNTRCSTSRNTLNLLKEHGIEPVIVDYLKTPPTRQQLRAMIDAAGLTVRGAMREKEAIFVELGLGNADCTDTQLLDAMLAHPILINRPFVVSDKGARLCRPVERVLEILPE